jgi:hypothetical protein
VCFVRDLWDDGIKKRMGRSGRSWTRPGARTVGSGLEAGRAGSKKAAPLVMAAAAATTTSIQRLVVCALAQNQSTDDGSVESLNVFGCAISPFSYSLVG